jgi:hypothetical protein
LEILLRRLQGVHLSDSLGNWGLCTALQWTGPNNSLLSRKQLAAAMKQASQMEKLTAQVTRSNFSGAGDHKFSAGKRSKFTGGGNFKSSDGPGGASGQKSDKINFRTSSSKGDGAERK